MITVVSSYKQTGEGYGIMTRTVRFLGIPVFKSERLVFFGEDANAKVV